MAQRYLISYDLHKKTEESYKAVAKSIKSCGDAYEVQESVWIVFSDKKRDDIGDIIESSLKSDDKVIVIAINGVWHRGLDDGLSDFLAGHQNSK